MLIGLIGKKTAGKTFTARRLQISFENGNISKHVSTIIPFATCLKEMTETLLNYVGIPTENLKKDGEYLPKFSQQITLRDVYKALGIGLRKELYTDIWLDIWSLKASSQLQDNKIVLVDDVRFKNEAKKIKEMGGILIRIISTDTKDVALDNHPSEKEQEEIVSDYTLYNDKTQNYLNVVDGLYLKLLPIKKEGL